VQELLYKADGRNRVLDEDDAYALADRADLEADNARQSREEINELRAELQDERNRLTVARHERDAAQRYGGGDQQTAREWKSCGEISCAECNEQRDELIARADRAEDNARQSREEINEMRAERDRAEALAEERKALGCEYVRRLAEARVEIDRLRDDLQWLEDEAPVIGHDAWSCSVDMAGNRWTLQFRNDGKRERIRGRTLIDTISKARAALNRTNEK
jgi:chromosome segregation ATPase